MTRLHPFNPTEVAESGGSVSNGKQSAYVSEISAYVGNQKKRAQRRNAAPETLGPTPERLAKAGSYEEILVPIKDESTRANTRVARLQSLFDRYADKLSAEDKAAFAQAAKYYFDAQLATGGRVTSSYGDGRGGAYGPRSGGVPDHLRLAQAMDENLKAYLGEEVYQTFKDCAEVVEQMALGYPWRDIATRKGIDFGVLLLLCKMVKWWAHRERALSGRQAYTDHEIKLGRMARQERMAKEGRR